MQIKHLAIAVPLAAGLLASPAHANFTITPTFDSTFAADPNGLTLEATINSTIQKYNSLITSNGSAAILFHEDPTTGLGSSSFAPNVITYDQYRAALTTALGAGNPILANLPATNPVPGHAGSDVEATTPQLRMLGFNAPGNEVDGGQTYDSKISLNNNLLNYSRTGAQDANKYDTSSVVSHEIDEVLGLSSALDGTDNSTAKFNAITNVDSLDFYRYSANGVRSFTNDKNAQAYFSTDGGATKTIYFNQDGGGDFHDWASNGELYASATPHVQDAFGNPGVNIDLGAPEYTALQSIGYHIAPVPEASSAVSLGLMVLMGAGALAFKTRRRKTTTDA